MAIVEKFTGEGAATDDAINAFIRGDEEEWQGGGRHDVDVRGLGSGPDGDRTNLGNKQVPEPPSPPPVQEQTWNPTENSPSYQQRYGEEANEKGKWRRTAEEALEELRKAQADLAALRSMTGAQPQPYYPAQQPGATYYPNYPQYANSMPATGYTPGPAYSVPQAQPQPPTAPASFFPNKGEDDYVAVGDVNAVLREVVAPAVMQLWQQQQALNIAQNVALKSAVGITPQVEARLTASYPWLGSIQDGQPRIAAMQDILSRETNRPTAPVRTAQALQSPVEAAARRVTYIESAQQRSSAGPGEGPSVQQLMAQEFAAAKTASEKKAVLLKYGASQVNDFGSNVLTR